MTVEILSLVPSAVHFGLAAMEPCAPFRNAPASRTSCCTCVPQADARGIEVPGRQPGQRLRACSNFQLPHLQTAWHRAHHDAACGDRGGIARREGSAELLAMAEADREAAVGGEQEALRRVPTSSRRKRNDSDRKQFAFHREFDRKNGSPRGARTPCSTRLSSTSPSLDARFGEEFEETFLDLGSAQGPLGQRQKASARVMRPGIVMTLKKRSE